MCPISITPVAGLISRKLAIPAKVLVDFSVKAKKMGSVEPAHSRSQVAMAL